MARVQKSLKSWLPASFLSSGLMLPIDPWPNALLFNGDFKFHWVFWEDFIHFSWYKTSSDHDFDLYIAAILDRCSLEISETWIVRIFAAEPQRQIAVLIAETWRVGT